jgi:hypothetical protein
MEIKEIITYNLNIDTNILEVSFRTIEDNEDTQRTDHIDYTLTNEYGYELETESFDFFDDELEDETIIKNGDVELDGDELISFLNEYYLINPKLLPKSQLY